MMHLDCCETSKIYGLFCFPPVEVGSNYRRIQLTAKRNKDEEQFSLK